MSRGDQSIDEFYARHCAMGPANVVLVLVIGPEPDRYGIFSSLKNAEDWAAGFEGCSGIYIPYVVDCPEFGNLVKGELS